eukprot:CAMPEP_0116833098 /NCGR_PEP_ID=MMETSP0418-20121206/6248_1 /TAXON_ID=1158023 /ORGANISM="Astrosyne radiata, Strain 13vi08-1A" /LENGTH=696 /DNA_ID=CAMNT_0004462511 /DNA_START=24 /DNA_END=2114 /DNA_ORIENTATION=-
MRLYLGLVGLLVVETQGFGGHTNCVVKTSFVPSPSSTATCLRATVYQPDESGKKMQATFFESSEDASPLADIKEKISASHAAVLKSMAVAFSPPSKALTPRDIEEVHLTQVDAHHFDLEAVVRTSKRESERMEVPVEFPVHCEGSEDMEECVIHNLDELSEQAEQEVHRRMETDKRNRAIWKQLNAHKGPMEQIPDWFKLPETDAMHQECSSLRKQLNRRDRQSSTSALAAQALAQRGERVFVELAAVMAICPTGFCLRAMVHDKAPIRQSSLQEGRVVELFVPFQAEAYDPQGLRETVSKKISEDQRMFDESEQVLEVAIPTTQPQGGGDLFVQLKQMLASNVAALARIAVAHSPPSRKLDLKDVEHVEVLGLDNRHVDIEAVVCEDEGCVTLEVPVDFPSSCEDSDGMVECVLENMGRLNHRAQKHLKREEKRKNRERNRAINWEELVSDRDPYHYPDWWVPPVLHMVEAAQSMQQLLNDRDFQNDVRALAYKALKRREMEEAVLKQSRASASETVSETKKKAIAQEKTRALANMEKRKTMLAKVPSKNGDNIRRQVMGFAKDIISKLHVSDSNPTQLSKQQSPVVVNKPQSRTTVAYNPQSNMTVASSDPGKVVVAVEQPKPGRDDMFVELAAVVDVGPRGLCMKAWVHPVTVFEEETVRRGKSEIVGLHLRFENEAKHPTELRSAVLQQVQS